MEAKLCVTRFTSKKGTTCTALKVVYGNDRTKLFFASHEDFMALLDVKPSEYFDLPNGDYPIK